MVNPGNGVNVTTPLASTVQVPWLATTNVVSIVGVLGSKSIVAKSNVSPVVSFDTILITAGCPTT